MLEKKGRRATPLPPNESKIRLSDVLRVRYHSESPFSSDLKIATIVHHEFYEEIEQTYLVVPLLPSCLVNTVDAGQPRLIVIHRKAFHEGPWFGTEDAAGGKAFEEVRRLLPWSRKRGVPVIYVEDGSDDGYHTEKLREIGTVHFPSQSFFERLTEQPRRSRIYELSEKFAHGSEMTLSESD